MDAVTRFFHLSERGTNLRTEILAGLTTFMTMAYIIFVNPGILSSAGVPVRGRRHRHRPGRGAHVPRRWASSPTAPSPSPRAWA